MRQRIRWIFLLGGLIVGSCCCMAQEVARSLWIPTDQTQAWNAVNEAALPRDITVMSNPGIMVPGVKFALKNTAPIKQNGSWTFSGMAPVFEGVSGSVLCLDVYIPDEKLLKKEGWAWTLKVGNDANHCLIYQFYPSMAGHGEHVLKSGWNKLRLPLIRPTASKGEVDWSQLNFLQLLLWLPEGDVKPSFTLANGVWLEHPNAPNAGSCQIGFNERIAVFHPGDLVEFTVTGDLSFPVEQDVPFDVEVRDCQDRLFATRSFVLPVGEKSFSEPLSVTLTDFGGYHIELVPKGGNLSLADKAPALFVVDHDLTDFVVPEDDQYFWGICAHLHDLNTQPELQDDMVALMRRMGARVSRFDIMWKLVEQEKGVWDWSGPDRYRDLMKTHNMKALPGLRYTPKWATTFDPAVHHVHGKPAEFSWHKPKNWADWEEFVRRAVTRYKDDYEVYEIWNEPNWEFWSDSAEEFLNVIRIGYPLIKEIDPDSTVVLGGQAGAVFKEKAKANTAWFGPMVTENFCPVIFGQGAQWFDDIAWHIYYDGDIPAMEADVWDEMMGEVTAANLTAKGNWNNECGYDAGPNHTDAGMSAALIRLASWTRAVGMKNFMWYKIWRTMWRDERAMQHGLLPFWKQVGVIQGTAGYVAYQATVKNLAGTRFVKRFAGDDGVDGFVFEKREGGRVLVVWRMGSSKPWNLSSVEGQVVELFDAMGNRIEFAPEVELGEMPCFVHFN